MSVPKQVVALIELVKAAKFLEAMERFSASAAAK